MGVSPFPAPRKRIVTFGAVVTADIPRCLFCLSRDIVRWWAKTAMAKSSSNRGPLDKQSNEEPTEDAAMSEFLKTVSKDEESQ